MRLFRFVWSPARVAITIALAVTIVFLAQVPMSSQARPSDQVTLRIIVVGSADAAQRVIDQMTQGSDFATLARQVSINPSAEGGGLLGRVERAALRPELRAALENLPTGQVSRAIQIPTGVALLMVVPDAESTATEPAVPNAAIGSAGSVRHVLDVDGLSESLTALNQFPKAADWNLDPRTMCDTRTRSLSAAQESLQTALASGTLARTAARPFDLMQAYFMLGQIHAYRGEMAQTIEQFEKAYRVAASSVPATLPQLEEALGLAYLHKAEMDNDIYHQPGNRDLLTPAGLGVFTRTPDAEQAVQHFLRYLADKPDSLEVRWLLNLAYMTVGGYPGRVPPPYLIPPAALASARDVGHFVDVAPEAGLTSFAMAGGLIVDDFDNDGRLAVVTSSMNSCAPMHFFRRDAGGLFTEQAAKAGLGDQLGGLNMLQTDFNNDGCLDILVLRGGWEVPERKSLLRNNCDGTFTDVTMASGLGKPTATQTAVWTDIDNDGWIDLFVGNEDSPAQLFLNQRDGTFKDVAPAAGVDRTAFSKGVAAADYDHDGWPDLYVSNLGGTNFLYHNNHNGTFTDVAKAARVPGSGRGFATWFFDYDNDGWDDLFVTSYFTSVDETVRTYLDLPHNAAPLALYRNLGNGTFSNVTRQAGLDKVFMPMGANFGDIDNDGFPDIYLGTGNPSYASLVRSVLLHNRDGQTFEDVTASSGTGELHKGHGVAFADLDNDGSDDLLFEVGGATPADAHALRAFRNPGNDNDWITLKLVGARTNRGAVGAHITVTVEGTDGQPRVIHRTVGSGGSFGASPLAQHIGLGHCARLLDVEIWWPASGTRQHVTDVDKNEWREVTEFARDSRLLARPRLPFGPPHHGGSPRAR